MKSFEGIKSDIFISIIFKVQLNPKVSNANRKRRKTKEKTLLKL